MKPTPKILIVDDHPVLRCGLQVLLGQAGMSVCGEAESLAAARRILASVQPDLILGDLCAREESGLALIRTLPAPRPPVLVYSMHEDWPHVKLALQAGATGYVTKREPPNLLLAAIRALLAGESYLSPQASQAMAETEWLPRGLQGFSKQELELLRHLAKGLGVGEVAEAMALSRKTVESYCGRMQVKLNLKGMRELRQLARATGGVA